MNNLSEIIIPLMRRAGKIMLEAENIESQDSLSEKGDAANLVTVYDVAVQSFLLTEIKKAIPDATFIAEEKENDPSVLDGEHCFIIDPIDGTTNFIQGYRHSCTSVALLKDGKPYIGVVYNPWTDELFTAERGKGAALNGKPIHVSDRPLKSACFFTAWSTYKKEFAKACFAISEEVYYDTCDIRRLGVCALELCYMAAGRGELYFEIRLFPWDYAAAQLILTEAGGCIGTIGMDAPTYTRPQPIVAANTKENFDYLMQKVTKYVPTIPYED